MIDLDKAKAWEREHDIRDVYVRTAAGTVFRGQNLVVFAEPANAS